MKERILAAALAVTTLAILASPAFAQAEVGKAAPEFTLPAVDGQTHSLSSFKGSLVVLEWLNYDCPFVKKHYGAGNMPALQAEYGGKGVVWLSINSSAPGKQGNMTPEEWTARNAKEGNKAKAVLLDPDGTVGRAYGAKTTPHMFIVNPDGVLIYAGAIDDKPSANPNDIAGATNYVRQALDEALAGKPVSVPTSRAYGCSVKY